MKECRVMNRVCCAFACRLGVVLFLRLAGLVHKSRGAPTDAHDLQQDLFVPRTDPIGPFEHNNVARLWMALSFVWGRATLTQ